MTSSDRNSAKVSRASLRFILPNAAYFYASTDKCTEVMCKMRPQNDVTGCSKRGSKRLQCSK